MFPLMLWQSWHSFTLPEAVSNHKILVQSSSQCTITKMCYQFSCSYYMHLKFCMLTVRLWRRMLPCFSWLKGIPICHVRWKWSNNTCLLLRLLALIYIESVIFITTVAFSKDAELICFVFPTFPLAALWNNGLASHWWWIISYFYQKKENWMLYRLF